MEKKMKKHIIVMTLLFLSIAGLEAKGGGVAGGALGFATTYSLTRAAGSGSRGDNSRYYERKIKAKEDRNERLQKDLDDAQEELKKLKKEKAKLTNKKESIWSKIEKDVEEDL